MYLYSKQQNHPLSGAHTYAHLDTSRAHADLPVGTAAVFYVFWNAIISAC